MEDNVSEPLGKRNKKRIEEELEKKGAKKKGNRLVVTRDMFLKLKEHKRNSNPTTKTIICKYCTNQLNSSNRIPSNSTSPLAGKNVCKFCEPHVRNPYVRRKYDLDPHNVNLNINPFNPAAHYEGTEEELYDAREFLESEKTQVKDYGEIEDSEEIKHNLNGGLSEEEKNTIFYYYKRSLQKAYKGVNIKSYPEHEGSKLLSCPCCKILSLVFETEIDVVTEYHNTNTYPEINN